MFRESGNFYWHLKSRQLGSNFHRWNSPLRWFFSVRFCMGIGFTSLIPQNTHKICKQFPNFYCVLKNQPLFKDISAFSLPTTFYHFPIWEILSSFSAKGLETALIFLSWLKVRVSELDAQIKWFFSSLNNHLLLYLYF